LAETRAARPKHAVIIGFALETDDALAGGRAKLASKDLDLVVVNNAREPGAGFATDTNKVTFVWRDGRVEERGLMPKQDVADEILDRAQELMRGR
ncbi:MAG: bifunctional 4'-phosphopantothenoylcysteine decarboxylase/phosphopantothenoylcysteine synthetase, partial [Gemmatimonadota bacterium]|nr:bifunctional 4'-phosphopantothenoylcysteine decarboxylase/phosphopantothenoylcysteine synthetase [Gemmatimonadota bacterium]